MQRASLSPSPDHLAPEMVRMNSDDVQEQDRLTPFLASGLIPVAVVPTTTQFGPSRGESPSTQPSTSARHALVTPIAHLALEQFSTSIPVCMDALTPEKRPIRKPPTKTMVPKATRVVPDFAAFAATLSDCVEKGEYRLELTADGAGGTYFVKARASDITIAVFKPAIQEIGEIENPRGNMRQDEKFDMSFRPGEGYKRERLAYLLDHGHFAGVPETCFTEVHGECGSLQKFVPSMMQTWSTTPAKFDTASVQRIAVFDIRTLNADRHGGNMLVRRDAPSMCVVPIDHGYILPDGWCDPDFEWLLWPQSAAQVPDDIRDYVARLDCDADAALVSAELGDACGEVIAVTTKLLQVALRHGKRYTMRDVGNFCRRQHATQPSGLEALMTASRRDLDEGGDLDMDSVVLRLESAFP